MWAVPMWPCQQYTWGLRGQGPDLIAVGPGNLDFFLCGGMAVVPPLLRPSVRSSGAVSEVLAHQLAFSRCSARATVLSLPSQKCSQRRPIFQSFVYLDPPHLPLPLEFHTLSSHRDSSRAPETCSSLSPAQPGADLSTVKQSGGSHPRPEAIGYYI